MNTQQSQALKIGIIGAGFSGTTLAANIYRLSQQPVDIYLFEKTGNFGTGYAYSSPFFFHLLNVRAKDMSAFEDDSLHFVNWISSNPDLHIYLDQAQPIGDQFMPRLCYGYYLKQLLNTVYSDRSGTSKLKLESSEAIDIVPKKNQLEVVQKNGKAISVDKVILALGNNEPPTFPFPVDKTTCITNPWDYTKPQQIASDHPVLIVGTGLSMIDVVLTLHYQKHQGKIYAISRHGLMPLPHADNIGPFLFMKEELPIRLNHLIRHIRIKSKDYADQGGDWRSVINGLRALVPGLWSQIHLEDKKRFLRHVLPYWNIHRHRVHSKLVELLVEKIANQQFKLISGRIMEVKNDTATIKMRHTHEIVPIRIKWLINCLGPSLNTINTSNTMSLHQPLIDSLLRRGLASVDPLNLGLMTTSTGALQEASGNISSMVYTLGSLKKGMIWESNAVPEIRKQSLDLATHLLNLG